MIENIPIWSRVVIVFLILVIQTYYLYFLTRNFILTMVGWPVILWGIWFMEILPIDYFVILFSIPIIFSILNLLWIIFSQVLNSNSDSATLKHSKKSSYRKFTVRTKR